MLQSRDLQLYALTNLSLAESIDFLFNEMKIGNAFNMARNDIDK